MIPVTEHDCFIHFDEHLLDHRLWQPILMKRYPNADPNATVADVVDPTEMVEIVREAETRTETFTKSKIEQGAREVYRRRLELRRKDFHRGHHCRLVPSLSLFHQCACSLRPFLGRLTSRVRATRAPYGPNGSPVRRNATYKLPGRIHFGLLTRRPRLPRKGRAQPAC